MINFLIKQGDAETDSNTVRYKDTQMKAEDRITHRQGMKCRRFIESQQKVRARQKQILLCSLQKDLRLQPPELGHDQV